MRNINEGIANDVVRLALDGELFTTDGEQVKFELIEALVFRGSRVLRNKVTKQVFNKLQTSHYKGYQTSLAYIYNRYEYDMDEIISSLIDLVGSGEEIEDNGYFFNYAD